MASPTDDQAPRDLFRDRKLQALAGKHGIRVVAEERPCRFGKMVVGRIVAEDDYARWSEVHRKYLVDLAAREAKRAKAAQTSPMHRALMGTAFERILEGISPTDRNFGQDCFARLMAELSLTPSDVSFEFKLGCVEISTTHCVSLLGKAISIRYWLLIKLVEFARRMARATSPARCVKGYSARILRELKAKLQTLEGFIAELPGAALVTAEEIHALVVEDGSLWSTDDVRLQARVAAGVRSKHEQNVALHLVGKHAAFEDYLSCFPQARRRKRRITAILGPTNSGKTWQALARLAKAPSGVYLGPLRLMALEQQEALEEMSVGTSLITGEERVFHSATHSSRTVELAPFDCWLDVAVIDEFQMVSDPDRGWAWVAALCGVPAAEIVVVGSPAALPVIEALTGICGDDLEIQQTSRNGTLEIAPVLRPSELPKRTAVVCFSRRMVIEVREMLQSRGISCSAVYGDLSPEVRREEARRFRDGETDVVVASDAIGMGLNLPIDLVAFWQTDKFDGKMNRPLAVSEIHQIAGRAGRGLDATGRVTAFSERDHQRIAMALGQSPPPLPAETLAAAPTLFHLDAISKELNENKMAKLLEFFVERTRFAVPLLRATVSAPVHKAAKLLDEISVLPPIHARFAWLHAPVDLGLDWSAEEFKAIYRRFCAGNSCHAPLVSRTSKKLGILEDDYRRLRTYRWLGQHFPDQFVDLQAVENDIKLVNERILEILRAKGGEKLPERLECDTCHRALLLTSRYGTCSSCHEEELSYIRGE